MPTIAGTNYPGTYEAQFPILVQGETHVHRISFEFVNDVQPNSSITLENVETKDGSSRNAVTALTDYLAVVAALYNTEATFGDITIWKYQTGTFIKDFVDDVTVTQAGTNANATGLANQITFTFKSTNQGRMKLTYLEANQQAFQKVPLGSTLGAAAAALRDEVMADNTFIRAYDGGFIGRGLNYLVGQNETTFEARYR